VCGVQSGVQLRDLQGAGVGFDLLHLLGLEVRQEDSVGLAGEDDTLAGVVRLVGHDGGGEDHLAGHTVRLLRVFGRGVDDVESLLGEGVAGAESLGRGSDVQYTNGFVSSVLKTKRDPVKGPILDYAARALRISRRSQKSS
jgi:hypothetical protein